MQDGGHDWVKCFISSCMCILFILAVFLSGICCDLWPHVFPWQMIILCEAQEYKVAVNGFHQLNYKHRVQDLSCVDVIEIVGELELKDVKIWWAAPAWWPFPCFLQPSIFNQPETPAAEANLNYFNLFKLIWTKMLVLVWPFSSDWTLYSTTLSNS